MPSPYDESAFYNAGYSYNWKYATAGGPWALSPAAINPLASPAAALTGFSAGQHSGNSHAMMSTMGANGLSGLGAASTGPCHYNPSAAASSAHMYRNSAAAAAVASDGSLTSLRHKAKLHSSPYIAAAAASYSPMAATSTPGAAAASKYPSCQFGTGGP